MLESGDGLIAPATRQNAGKPGIAFPAGGAKSPAGTDSARVIAVAGSASRARLSQSCAALAAPAQSIEPRKTNHLIA